MASTVSVISSSSGTGGMERTIRTIAMLACVLLLLILVVIPIFSLLSQSMFDDKGNFVGLSNYQAYFANPALRQSIVNSLFIAVLTTSITVPLAFGYSYALTRTRLPFKALFKGIAYLPILAPSLLPAIALIYIFGNQGFLTYALQGQSIYGPIGIVTAQVFYAFPFATLILTTALANSDARLYEVAETLATSPYRTFRTITLPAARYGLVNAAAVVFTIAIVDFGIVKVIGGQYSVLAIEVYKQIIGQQKFQLGAVIGVLLILPTIVTFTIERLARRGQTSQLSARSVLLRPKSRPLTDIAVTAFTVIVAAIILFIIGVAIFASLVTFWPYDLTLALGNYDFSVVNTSGWSSYVNSLRMAAWTAIVGTAVVFVGAYLAEKTKVPFALRGIMQLFAMMPIAIPGITLGLGYIFFFNSPSNPLNFLYGTTAILVMVTIAHYYTVPHLTAVTALRQLDEEFEAASEALGTPFWKTMWRVTLPICVPALIDIATFFFVNAMTTVAAVIFLYGPGGKLASIAVVEMDDTGDTAYAAAMAVMILLTSAIVKLCQTVVTKYLLTHTQRWRQAHR
ncbi:putative 2-aminoethylphosphonate ABC transporter permease subunit [Rhizobium sp. AN80A]|uniref:putative 2-aminoethylphosphonate ABC transporter permease subunit n=1 Tax=Rhizobium sp. AN80A TaxID=3040673 RepID=UPI0024B38974|nr:putative 2-aminoethylphosphonate ABC transporter permease subunit [Rhizobium sp. AN80A]